MKIIYLIPFVYFQKVLSNIYSECFVYQIFVHLKKWIYKSTTGLVPSWLFWST